MSDRITQHIERSRLEATERIGERKRRTLEETADEQHRLLCRRAL